MKINRNFCNRLSLVAGAITGTVLLSACSAAQSSVTDLVDGAVQTASGKITEIKDKAKQAIQPVTDVIDDAQKRIDAVGSGVLKLKEGIEQVKGAVKR